MNLDLIPDAQGSLVSLNNAGLTLKLRFSGSPLPA